MIKIQNFINGKFVSPQSNQYIESYNPTIGKPFALIPDSE